MSSTQTEGGRATDSISFPDIEISEALIRRFDRSGPRYTSYPTADRFKSGYTEQAYLDHLGRRAAADAHHVRPHLGEEHGRERAGADSAQLDDPDTGQWSHFSVSSTCLSGAATIGPSLRSDDASALARTSAFRAPCHPEHCGGSMPIGAGHQ